MAIKQISVYAENKPGKVVEIVKALADEGINMRAMSVADTKDFGLLRAIVSDAAKAKEVLLENYLVTVTDVLAVEMKDEAGALRDILTVLSSEGINIEYMYAFTAPASVGAYVVIRVDDNDTAEKALAKAGIATLGEGDLKL